MAHTSAPPISDHFPQLPTPSPCFHNCGWSAAQLPNFLRLLTFGEICREIISNSKFGILAIWIFGYGYIYNRQSDFPTPSLISASGIMAHTGAPPFNELVSNFSLLNEILYIIKHLPRTI